MVRLISLRAIALLLLGAVLGSVFAPTTARAEGLTVEPNRGTAGTVFQFSSSGFTAGELVALWLAHPDGTVQSQGYTKADPEGKINFASIPTADWGYGVYTQVAYGMRSKLQGDAQFEYYAPEAGPGASGSSGCAVGVFSVGGFAPGELVATWYGAPDGTYGALPHASADSAGVVSFTFTPEFGAPAGMYVVAARGAVSKFETAQDYFWDGVGFTGEGDCTVNTTAPTETPQTSDDEKGTVLFIPKNIANYQGAGVYLNAYPEELYYFDCDWKWRPMGGTIYMLTLGFQPNEVVKVQYEVLEQTGIINHSTVSADENGNVQFSVDESAMPEGHYHWHFIGKSASYCGHYDSSVPGE